MRVCAEAISHPNTTFQIRNCGRRCLNSGERVFTDPKPFTVFSLLLLLYIFIFLILNQLTGTFGEAPCDIDVPGSQCYRGQQRKDRSLNACWRLMEQYWELLTSEICSELPRRYSGLRATRHPFLFCFFTAKKRAAPSPHQPQR